MERSKYVKFVLTVSRSKFLHTSLQQANSTLSHCRNFILSIVFNMPTLMETAAPVPNVEQTPPVSAPAALTLTFGGVEFALTPTDTNAELSYKNKGQDIILSLSSFTGSLKVSLKGMTAALPQLQQTTATVEEEPNSPQVAQKAPSFMPGQTKLSFQKKQTAKSQERKRTVELVTPKSSAKKSRKNTSSKTTAAPSLCQTMEKPTQATQDLPDLSQTMHSQIEDGSDSALYQTPSSSSAATDVKQNASVREILDRVNSSNDSVATIRDDDEISIASKADKPSLEIIEDEKKEAPTNTKNDTTATATATVPMVLDDDPDDPKNIPSPSPRWGHTMTKIKGDRLLVYGGQSFDLEGNPIFLDDVHVYNTSKRTWEKPIQCRGDKRQWHSATFLPERQLLISFGGETMDLIKKSKVVTSDTLRVLDTDIMLWYPPAVSGDVPTARSGHTATLLPNTNELVLFGGVKGARWLNTVSVLNTVRWVWTTPKVEGTLWKCAEVAINVLALTLWFFI
jgi:hypothetical protein